MMQMVIQQIMMIGLCQGGMDQMNNDHCEVDEMMQGVGGEREGL